MWKYEDEEEAIIKDHADGLISRKEMDAQLSRLYWKGIGTVKHIDCDCMSCLPPTY